MYSKFFAPRPRVPAQRRVPAETRVYAIGDIHGRVDLLHQLHRMIEEDSIDAGDHRRVAVYLGDYVDRGSSSRDVIELLLDQPLRGFHSVHLSGNHEEMMLTFLDDASVGPMWMYNGGDATLLSYGVRHRDAATAEERQRNMQKSFRESLPDRHLDFLRSLQITHQERDYLFVHAGIMPGLPLDRQKKDDMLWIREDFIASNAEHGKCIVHGHTIVPEPDFRDNRIGIDTGAYFTDNLSCLILEGDERRIIQTGRG